jgi:LysR family glycine cleavage system transcriptional activator
MRTPSTRTLKAFQLAARSKSFKLAASELCLSPSAVSYRVKALEEDIGIQLFHRGARELSLTDAGFSYLCEIEALFRRLEKATRELRARQGRRSLTLRVAPFFASEFLLPRLEKLHAVCPDVDMQIDADGSGTPAVEEADVSIVLGSGPWPGTHAHRLFGQSYVAACAPALVAREPVCGIGDLDGRALLVHKGRKDGWDRWAEAAGVDAPRPRKRISFDTMTELVHAAERGAGVGLIPVPLAAGRLRARLLVRLFEQSLQTGESYFLLHRADGATRPEIGSVREWILSEVHSGLAAHRSRSSARSTAARGLLPSR